MAAEDVEAGGTGERGTAGAADRDGNRGDAARLRVSPVEGADDPGRMARDRAQRAGTYDEDLVKWLRAMGLGYQARMNAVLRA